MLAKELYPGRFHPTISHAFIALLASKGLLLHLFTQNIDCLERAAGVPPHLIVEAHGSFATQRCIDCGTPFPDALMKEHVVKGEVPRCAKRNDDGGSCGSLVKPDIVFFGEQLPEVFRARQHYPGLADLVLILGTSLQVYPFAGLPETVQEKTPRALFNLERVGSLGTLPDDVLCLGSCDAGVRALADELGWREELEKKWRSLVGDEEAEMQLRNAQKREQIMEDEVVRLAEEIEDVLHIEEDANDANESNETSDTNESNDTHEAQKLVRAIPELQTQDRDTGQTPEVKGQEVSSNSEANTAAQEASFGSRVEATSPSRSQTSRLSKADGEDKNQDQQHSDSNAESDHGRKEGQTPTSSENQGKQPAHPLEK